jgi:predicted nucleic acid-binding protein
MDAAGLLGGDEPFVIDTSTWWRIRRLPADLARPLRAAISDGRALITPLVRIEILYSARTSTEYSEVDAELAIFRMLRNDRAAADAAISALRELSEHADGYHRVPVADALIAAAAADQGGLAVLHKDAHFDRLAEVLAFESVTLPVD